MLPPSFSVTTGCCCRTDDADKHALEDEFHVGISSQRYQPDEECRQGNPYALQLEMPYPRSEFLDLYLTEGDIEDGEQNDGHHVKTQRSRHVANRLQLLDA